MPTTEVAVPDIGDFDDIPVIEVHVAAGDVVAVDDPLVTLESDKATMDVPSSAAGEVRELLVKVGDRVSRGSPLIAVEEAGTSAVVEPPTMMVSRNRHHVMQHLRPPYRKWRLPRSSRHRRPLLHQLPLQRRISLASMPGRAFGGSPGSWMSTCPRLTEPVRRVGSPRKT